MRTFFLAASLLILAGGASADPVWVNIVSGDPNNQHVIAGRADAEADIAKNTMKVKGRGGLVVGTELSRARNAIESDLLRKYGVVEEDSGCIDPPGGDLYVQAYNSRITKELEGRHGAGFWNRIEAEVSRRLASNKALQPTGPASGGSGG